MFFFELRKRTKTRGEFGFSAHAVFADVGVALVAICNALRALIVKNNKKNK